MSQAEVRRIGLRTHLHDAAVARGRMPAGRRPQHPEAEQDPSDEGDAENDPAACGGRSSAGSGGPLLHPAQAGASDDLTKDPLIESVEQRVREHLTGRLASGVHACASPWWLTS
jgi:hypothetical protein